MLTFFHRRGKGLCMAYTAGTRGSCCCSAPATHRAADPMHPTGNETPGVHTNLARRSKTETTITLLEVGAEHPERHSSVTQYLYWVLPTSLVNLQHKPAKNSQHSSTQHRVAVGKIYLDKEILLSGPLFPRNRQDGT